MRKLLLICLFLLTAFSAWATHQRAAEITYLWKGGNSYEFTMTCYYTSSEAGVQRDSLLVNWGDGFADMMPRQVFQDLGDDYFLSVYKMVHEFSSSGTYVISMEDPNRNYGVVNVPNSVAIPMYIETELVINPYLGFNNSVQLLNAPVDKGCVGKPYYHHPSAYDPDGDSLSYRLVPCKGADGQDIPGYTYPQASSFFDIDPVTGLLQWENPVLQGEYNVAILVEEWRHGVKIGSVIRDMQILISACDNDLPVISMISDTCVVAGASLNFLISAYDPNGNQVTLEASGAPFALENSPAVLTPPTDFGLQPTIGFSWQTACNHIRKSPYQVVVRARDNAAPVSLTNVQAVNISVIGPAVQNLQVENGKRKVEHFPFSVFRSQLTWSPYTACSNVSAIRVYRRTGSNPYQPDPCETGVRPGYQKIAELPADATSFLDTNGGADFVQGVAYCYRVVAVFHGDVESQPSEEVCVQIPNNTPLMTKVSCDEQDLASGQMRVEWVRPRDIESYFTKPYNYRLIRNANGIIEDVYSGEDTTFHDVEVDLSELQSLSYHVEMKDANGQLIGKSAVANAIMLSGTAGDAKVSLAWTGSVPWIIDSTEVFRTRDSVFRKIAGTETLAFEDNRVENDVKYRYYVRTFGHYSLEGLPTPLVNYSAMIEVTPTENEEPEPEEPVYELPNVFTPNGDSFNDVFVPMRITAELIDKVDFHVFNRWGRVVFTTNDIFINWDGRASDTRQPCPSGTYYYICDVEMTGPEGPVSKRLEGVVMIVK